MHRRRRTGQLHVPPRAWRAGLSAWAKNQTQPPKSSTLVAGDAGPATGGFQGRQHRLVPRRRCLHFRRRTSSETTRPFGTAERKLLLVTWPISCTPCRTILQTSFWPASQSTTSRRTPRSPSSPIAIACSPRAAHSFGSTPSATTTSRERRTSAGSHTKWTATGPPSHPANAAAGCAHVLEADFPETETWMKHETEAAGFKCGATIVDKPYFKGWLFEKR